MRIVAFITGLMLSVSVFSTHIIYGEYQFFREPKVLKIYMEDQKICFEQDFARIIFNYSDSTIYIGSDKIKTYCVLKMNEFNQQISEATQIAYNQLLNNIPSDKRDSLKSLYNFIRFSDTYIVPRMPKFVFEKKSEKSQIAGKSTYQIFVKNGKTIVETLSFAQDSTGLKPVYCFETFKMLQLFLPELSFSHQLTSDYQNIMNQGIPLSILSKNFNWKVTDILNDTIDTSIFSFSENYNVTDPLSLMNFLAEDRYQSLLN